MFFLPGLSLVVSTVIHTLVPASVCVAWALLFVFFCLSTRRRSGSVPRSNAIPASPHPHRPSSNFRPSQVGNAQQSSRIHIFSPPLNVMSSTSGGPLPDIDPGCGVFFAQAFRVFLPRPNRKVSFAFPPSSGSNAFHDQRSGERPVGFLAALLIAGFCPQVPSAVRWFCGASRPGRWRASLRGKAPCASLPRAPTSTAPRCDP